MSCLTMRWLSAVVCLTATLLFSDASDAHFLWIKTLQADGKQQALLFFNESPYDESYHFPDKLAKAKLWARAADSKLAEVATSSIDTEDRVGRIGLLRDDQATALQVSQQYGIYGTALLAYYAKCVTGKTADAINSAGTSKELKLEIVPKIADGQIVCKVLREGQPAAGVDVSIFKDQKEPSEEKTNKEGEVRFSAKPDSLVGVLANTMDEHKGGELGGKSYKGELDYASLTLRVPHELEVADVKPNAKEQSKKSTSKAAKFVPLPEPLASFGAAILDDWLYVYGGHTGEEHQHSVANLSNHFRRIKLDSGKKWEELPMQTPLQGLPLVVHAGKIYRVGGLDVRNATLKEKEDDHSSAEFAQYDPATNKWTALAPLPAPRSSHNAVVIGERLYVVGGWNLQGKVPGAWEPDALFYDFSRPNQGWQKLSRPEFKRRALAAGQWNGRLVVMGGMDEKANISMNTFVFDPATKIWTKGPDLPGAGMAGFGVSACSLNGELYECGARGVLYKLNRAGTAWEEAGRLETGRFFHQLVPATGSGLLVIGGASASGQLATIERVEIEAQKQ